MTDLHTAARQALPLLERDCTSLLACHQDPATGAIPAEEPEVVAMYDEYVSAITALRAAMEAQQEPAQPQGWVLVPEEPTPWMCAAGVQALCAASVGDIETAGSEARITYIAMLAARPQPKEPQA